MACLRWAMADAGDQINNYSSMKISSLRRRMIESAGANISKAATTSMVALIGRSIKTIGSHRESNKARQRCSSIIGPRMKPNNKGEDSRTEERRLGKKGVSTYRSRWSKDNQETKT